MSLRLESPTDARLLGNAPRSSSCRSMGPPCLGPRIVSRSRYSSWLMSCFSDDPLLPLSPSNLSYNPPHRPGLDDVTSEPLIQRSDDNEATFRSRLEAFRTITGPMIKHFEETSQRLDEAEGKGAGRGRVYVSLRGKTSKEIWPQLREVMRRRFDEGVLSEAAK